jgi:ribonuclease BN (tRNA processing enzyme)
MGGAAGRPDAVQELAQDRTDSFTVADLTIKTAPVSHIASSLAYRVESGGRAVVYSGDTDWSDSLIELARGADCLVLEASNPFKVPGHLTPGEAGRLAAQTRVPRLVLTHLYPPCDAVDVAAECSLAYPGEVILAEDGLRLEV